VIPLDEQIAELRRELALRQHSYPRLVAARRMRERTATRCLEALRAAISTLVNLKEATNA
jgi:hypothetical protein